MAIDNLNKQKIVHPKYGEISLFAEDDIVALVEKAIQSNIVRMEREGMGEKVIKKSFQNLEGLAVYDERENEQKKASAVAGEYSSDFHYLSIYSDDILEGALRHEITHAMSQDGYKTGLKRGRHVFEAINEIMTEYLSHEDGGYEGYEHYMLMFEIAFKEKKPTTKMCEAYYANDSETFIEEMAKLFGQTKEFVTQYLLKLDAAHSARENFSYEMADKKSKGERWTQENDENLRTLKSAYLSCMRTALYSSCYLQLAQLKNQGKEITKELVSEVSKQISGEDASYLFGVIKAMFEQQEAGLENKENTNVPLLKDLLKLTKTLDKEGRDKIESYVISKIAEALSSERTGQLEWGEDVLTFAMKKLSLDASSSLVEVFSKIQDPKVRDACFGRWQRHILDSPFKVREKGFEKIYKMHPKCYRDLALIAFDKNNVREDRKEGLETFFLNLSAEDQEFVINDICRQTIEIASKYTQPCSLIDGDLIKKIAATESGKQKLFPNQEIASNFIKTIIKADPYLFNNFKQEEFFDLFKHLFENEDGLREFLAAQFPNYYEGKGTEYRGSSLIWAVDVDIAKEQFEKSINERAAEQE